ncbi:glycine-rich domain-containing protein [Leminorella grimontii]|uniref:glycine-rich domain-containing protein n=1 Tax=Leminorella grimontii TaxID=82981 RepID=UPI00406AB3D8
MYTPTAGTKRIIVEAIGGGGASGGVGATTTARVSMSGCGTNGAYAKVLIDTPSAAPVIIGAGGAGVVNAAGNNGGTTSFGSYFSCPGGIGAGRGQSDMDPSNIYQAATNAREAPQPVISSGNSDKNHDSLANNVHDSLIRIWVGTIILSPRLPTWGETTEPVGILHIQLKISQPRPGFLAGLDGLLCGSMHNEIRNRKWTRHR